MEAINAMSVTKLLSELDYIYVCDVRDRNRAESLDKAQRIIRGANLNK